MSNTKTVMSQAANTQGLPLDITDVFSTYLYTGTGSAQTINNGIDLDGEGGLVWIKGRDAARSHQLLNTEVGLSGTGSRLKSDSTAVSSNDTATSMSSFNSDGFSINYATDFNANGEGFASWTFRKAPKFFDVVTYTGDGTVRNIPHNLGSVPGMIIVKRTDGTNNWYVQHRSTGPTKSLFLDTTSAATTRPEWGNTEPTDSVFTVDGTSVTATNYNGFEYVAYLFAHNDGDGEFGPDGDADIIKCGSYTGGGGTEPEIDLGFEPQWVMIKNASAASQWLMIDTMRGWTNSTGNDPFLLANSSQAESGNPYTRPLATGFQPQTSSSLVNASGNNYIYIAIRRGPLAPPESATEVFNPTYAYEFDIEGNTSSGNGIHGYLGNPTDLYIQGYLSGSSLNSIVRSRLTGGNYLVTNATNAETTSSINFWDNNVGSGFETSNSVNTSLITWNWKRAPGFCDVVAYTGSGANTVINHNLDAIPEMVWVKNRGRSQNWNVYHKDLELNGDPASECRLFLNTDAAVSSGPVFWGTHTDTTFTMTVQNFQTNYLNDTYTAYLFASLPGISKVGSYTGNGTSQTIDCGFTSGARFVLVKCTTVGYDWQIFDTERGIVAGTDSKLALNTTQAEQTSGDFIDPSSSGFAVTSSSSMNANGETFIFYAIA